MPIGATKRLLVVDDEKPIRQLLARIAQRAGFEVDTAHDGVEALENWASATTRSSSSI
ncbi:MAG TPA: hypothetical protein VM779_13245 [Thermoanaerobaculia bacterium]|nr:hypothetical protein [Thermoanaerobaculia bacterium]